MKRQRRTHRLEFKQEAVALMVEHGYRYVAAGRSLGMNGALIGRWKQQPEDNAVVAFDGKGTVEQQHIHELEAENRRLRMEREILRKATAFFAKGSS